MKVQLFNTVVQANDYNATIDWYQKVFGLDILSKEEEDYHYVDLGIGDHVIVGIAMATEMDHTPSSPRNNSTLMQLKVEGIEEIFEAVKAHGGTILFGPSYSEKYEMHYGAVADLEGNQIWMIQGDNI